MTEKQGQGSRSGPPTAGHPMNVEPPIAEELIEELFTPFERLLEQWEAQHQPKGSARDGTELTAVSVTDRLNKLFLTVIDKPSAESLEEFLDKELEGVEETRHEIGKVREFLLRERNALAEDGIEIAGYLRLLEKLEAHIYRKIVDRFAVAVRRARDLSHSLEHDDER